MDPSLRHTNTHRPFIGVKSTAVFIKSESVRDLLWNDKIKKIVSSTGISPPVYMTPMQHIVADTEIEPVVVERVISVRKLHLQQKSLLSMQNLFRATKQMEFKKKLDEIASLKQQVARQKELRKDEVIKKMQLVKVMQKVKQGQALHNQTVNLKKVDFDMIGCSEINDNIDCEGNIDEVNAASKKMDITLDDYYNGINLTELRKDISIGIGKPICNIKDPVSYKYTAKERDGKEIHTLAWNVQAPEIKTLASGFRVASPPSSRKSQPQHSAPTGLDSMSLHSQADGSVQSSTTDYSFLNVDELARKLMCLTYSIDYTKSAPENIPLNNLENMHTDYCKGTIDADRKIENSNNIVLEGNPVFDDSLIELSNSQVTQQNSFITADAVEIDNIIENIAIQLVMVESPVPINPASITDSLDRVINTKLSKKERKEANNSAQSLLKPVSITHADPILYIKSSTTVKTGLTQPQSKTMQGRYRSGTYKPGILELATNDPFKKPFM